VQAGDITPHDETRPVPAADRLTGALA
jgi:hypothetical protein